MGALGSSPAYYDFDSFQEIQVTTGGSDVTASTPGVQLNLVTKRGTNDVHGSARFFLADQQLAVEQPHAGGQAQGDHGGNRVNEVQDYGVEVGGPLWQDRSGPGARTAATRSTCSTLNGKPDNTTLKDINAQVQLPGVRRDVRDGHVQRRQQDQVRPQRQLLPSAAGLLEPGRPDAIWKGRGVAGLLVHRSS